VPLGIDDLSAGEFDALLDLAGVMKRHPLAWRSALEGRAVACLFEAPSTRSRVSLEVAVNRLGALPVVLQPTELRLGQGDSIADTARVLSSYCDAIAVRTDRHRDLLELAEHASVPVIKRAHRSRVPVPGTRRLPHVARPVRRAARPADRVCRGLRAGDAFADRGSDAVAHHGAHRGAAGAAS